MVANDRVGLRAFFGLAATLFAAALVGLACQGGPRINSILTSAEPPRELDHTEVSANDQHAALFEEESYPSARTCARCHPDHYREWSVSPHAYAQLSPVFNAMHATIVKLTNGTFGDFCIRCHTPVGMNLREPPFESNLNRHPASREGITCIACHRVDREYGKVSGRVDIVRGLITDPVYGPSDNKELKRVLANEEGTYSGIVADPTQTGNKIHADVESFFYLSKPGFCGTCHDVTLGNGFRLEEAFSDYKASPAAREGTTCQDCHMGTEPGVASEYATAPAAIVNGQPTKPRKRTNHMFPGPDYSIVHPGIFPHLDEDDFKLANMRQWLKFDVEAGWGTKEFEAEYNRLRREVRGTDRESELPEFPPPWDKSRARRDGRAILDKQFALLEEYRVAQLKVMRAGYQLGEVEVQRAGPDGLAFRVEVKNATNGHKVPTGFIAERTLYLEVTVTDARGEVVFVSGDTDPNGDVRDLHSVYVHNGELPLDEQLFSLQSKFITTNVRGSEREQVLAVNHSVDPLPFLRPSTISTIALGRPLGARIHRQSIPPLRSRWARYVVPERDLTGRPPYTARVRVIAGMVPPNLIHEIQHVGFDYGLSAREVADRVVAGRQVLWDREILLERE